MITILLSLNISDCVENLANSPAISCDSRLVTDISEQHNINQNTEAP